jgi:catechol 2,3-dioxygenase-like lactoylglutathione lyase family enzyme
LTETPLGNRLVTQIAIVVHDIEKAVETYSRVLGVDKPEIMITDEYEKAQTIYYGKPSRARCKLAFFHLGQIDLELMEPMGEPSVWKDVLNKRGQGVHHIAFHVPDTEAALKYLDSQGMPMIQQGHYTGGMYSYVDSESQLGVMLELLENFDQ